jgi:hypothetical protein
MNPNGSETKVIKAFSNLGYECLKGSFPDLLVWDRVSRNFCFVEVKRKMSDSLSADQSDTFHLMKFLGLPVQIFYSETEDLDYFERKEIIEYLKGTKYATAIGELKKSINNMSQTLSDLEHTVDNGMQIEMFDHARLEQKKRKRSNHE